MCQKDPFIPPDFPRVSREENKSDKVWSGMSFYADLVEKHTALVPSDTSACVALYSVVEMTRQRKRIRVQNKPKEVHHEGGDVVGAEYW